MPRRLLSLVIGVRLGLAATVAVLLGSWVVVALLGPLYGVWDWPELVLGGLILISFAFAGLEALVRPPNPYARSHPLYELRDIAPDRDLYSGGSGWVVQSIPPLAAATVLAVIFTLT